MTGYPYVLQQGAAQSGLVRFALDASEAYRPWCPIQDLFELDGGWSCLPGNDWTCPADFEPCEVQTPDGPQSFSAFQVGCLTLCDCNENGCFARRGDSYRVDLSLAEDGNALVGGPPERIGSVGDRLHLRRVE